MGGQSTQNSTSQQTQNQTQNSTTAPWAVAQPAVTGLLGQVQSGLGNTGLTGTENNALTTLQGNAGNYSSTVAPQISNYANTLFAGGGANNQAPALQGGLSDYQSALTGANNAASGNLATYQQQLTPYANGSMIGNNPALQAQLAQIGTDTTNQVNGSFAAAGRDFSGANSQALGRGIASGEAPVIAQQYNQDVANQMNAANALYGAGNTTNQLQTGNAGAGYGAGNTTGGLLAGLQQQYLANQGQGVTAAGQANDAANAAPNAALAAEAQRRGIPIQALGLLANIGIPIAGLGSQSSGTSSGTSNGTSNTESQASGAQQFAQIMGGIGSLGNLWGKSK
jgi:hypothetical protein